MNTSSTSSNYYNRSNRPSLSQLMPATTITISNSASAANKINVDTSNDFTSSHLPRSTIIDSNHSHHRHNHYNVNNTSDYNLSSIKLGSYNRKSDVNNLELLLSMKQYHNKPVSSYQMKSNSNDNNNRNRFIIERANNANANTNANNNNNSSSYRQLNDKSAKRKFMAQILPSKLFFEKTDEVKIENIPPNCTNTRRRASDSYSPYGTRQFPSLRQSRPPSTDSNYSCSSHCGSSVSNGIDLSSQRSCDNNVMYNSSSYSSTRNIVDDKSNLTTPVRQNRYSSTKGHHVHNSINLNGCSQYSTTATANNSLNNSLSHNQMANKIHENHLNNRARPPSHSQTSVASFNTNKHFYNHI